MLPGTSTRTVDKYWGANQIETHFLTHPGEFILKLTMADGTTNSYTVMWSEFSKQLQKRGADDFYSVSMTLEEV
jgi:hypothetical protein